MMDNVSEYSCIMYIDFSELMPLSPGQAETVEPSHNIAGSTSANVIQEGTKPNSLSTYVCLCYGLVVFIDWYYVDNTILGES